MPRPSSRRHWIFRLTIYRQTSTSNPAEPRPQTERRCRNASAEPKREESTMRNTQRAAAGGGAGPWADGAGGAMAQTAWDMPTPYPDGNFHTRNITEFAEEVGDADRRQAEDHRAFQPVAVSSIPTSRPRCATASCRSANSWPRCWTNESPIFGIDCQPFLATSYDEAKKLYDAQRPAMKNAACRPEAEAAVLGPLAAAGNIYEDRRRDRSTTSRHEVPRL